MIGGNDTIADLDGTDQAYVNDGTATIDVKVGAGGDRADGGAGTDTIKADTVPTDSYRLRGPTHLGRGRPTTRALGRRPPRMA